MRVADVETVKEALGLHWFSLVEGYCAREGTIVRVANERNAYVAFVNDPAIETITAGRMTLPITCLTVL